MPDEIEKHLRALPLRPVPPSWRREILAACDAAPSRLCFARFLLWLWPGPAPVAALAGMWLAIFGFFLATPPAPSSAPIHLDMAAVRAAREERLQILARLNEPGVLTMTRSGADFSFPLHPHGS